MFSIRSVSVNSSLQMGRTDKLLTNPYPGLSHPSTLSWIIPTIFASYISDKKCKIT